MINSGEVNVHLAEIEGVLQSCSGNHDRAISAFPTMSRECIYAAIQRDAGAAFAVDLHN